jgi:hypothetical protein
VDVCDSLLPFVWPGHFRLTVVDSQILVARPLALLVVLRALARSVPITRVALWTTVVVSTNVDATQHPLLTSLHPNE